MIIKCLSRKENVGQLIRYILAPDKLVPVKQDRPGRIRNMPGIPLSEKDKHHIEAEKSDGDLRAAFKAFTGSIKEFIDAQIKGSNKSREESERPMLIRNNVQGKTADEITKEFKANEAHRQNIRKNNVKAYHTIISFSNKSTRFLNDEILKDIATKYVSIRGTESLYVGSIHKDRGHIHIHMVMSGTEYYTGKSNRISRQQFQELKVTMQEYQKEKYPELNNSLPNLTKPKSTPAKNINAERSKDKNILTSLLETTYSKSGSLQELLDGLRSQGHEAYYRNGRLQGIKYNGVRKFRLQNLGFKEKLQVLDQLREQEATQLRELSSIRGRQNDRARTNEMPKSILYEDAIKGMNEDQVRAYQQGMVNSHRAFEKRQATYEPQKSSINPSQAKEKEHTKLNELSAIRDRSKDDVEIDDDRSTDTGNGNDIKDNDDDDKDEDTSDDRRDDDTNSTDSEDMDDE